MSTTREELDRHFSWLLGADMARAHTGEVLVAFSPRRDEPEEEHGSEIVTSPIWLLVSRGRGVLSSSRFLQRIARDWAEDFAAPELLLQPEFLEELRAAVARALDASVTIRRERLLIPPNSSDQPVLYCDESDRLTAAQALAQGCSEYGRLIRLIARR